MTVQGPLVNVLYGSVTGNAEEIARGIHSLLPEKGLRQGVIRCLSDHAHVPAFVKPTEHSHTYNVIIVSTTGEGDPPDTIRPFMRLMRSKDKSRLQGLNYTVLALGDTNYENFCKTGKRVDTTLPKLGAVRFLKRGDADDGVGLELVVEPWKDRLWDALSQISKTMASAPPVETEDVSESAHSATLSNSVENIVSRVTAEELGFLESSLPPIPVPKLSVHTLDSELNLVKDTFPSVHPSYNADLIRKASVKQARLLTAEQSDKTVWHMEVACESPLETENTEPMNYRPGDAFGILVENNTDEVERFLKVMNLKGDERIQVQNEDGVVIITTTAKKLIEQRLDIRATPSKTLLRVLSDYCEDMNERTALLQVASKKGRREYMKEIVNKHMTVLKVLETMASSCRAPMSVFVDMLPAIPLRWYSATSSPELDGRDVLHFAFSVVQNGLATNALAKTCTAFLAGETHTHADCLYILPRESDAESHFRPPQHLDTPYVMIGPGTGVAPFRGFLRERLARLQDAGANENVCGSDGAFTMLFFGCRNRVEDYLYEDDLQHLVDAKSLHVLDVAFSREGEEKVYVQDRLLARRDEVARVLQNDGCIFVCGDGGGMAIGVHNALTSIVTETLCNGNEEEGKSRMNELAKTHRYVRDIWYHG